MSQEMDIRIDEIVTHSAGRVDEVIYEYTETPKGAAKKTYNISVKRADFDRFATLCNKPMLPYDQFLKVLRPFMMGKHAEADIPEAFRILDTDHSGTIDIGELAAYMPIIVPDANPYVLLHHVQKVDKNSDYKLNLSEFTDLIKQGIGRDISVGKM